MATADQKLAAYYQGRNQVWRDHRVTQADCPIEDRELAEEWKAGVRHARAEIRLNADTDWD